MSDSENAKESLRSDVCKHHRWWTFHLERTEKYAQFCAHIIVENPIHDALPQPGMQSSILAFICATIAIQSKERSAANQNDSKANTGYFLSATSTASLSEKGSLISLCPSDKL